jgi:hypothetical protein
MQNGRKVVYEVKQEIDFSLVNTANSTSSIVPAQIPGGADGLRRELKRFIDYDIKSKIYAPPGSYSTTVVFNVSKEGIVSNARTITKSGYGIDEHIVSLFNTSPKWIPAIKDGFPVDSEVTHSVGFTVPRNDKTGK